MVNREEFIDEIERAIEMVSQAKYIVDMVMDGNSMEANYKAYGKYGFDQLLGSGNPYDNSLQTLIDKVVEE